MVERPYCSRASRARSTASRISFTPDEHRGDRDELGVERVGHEARERGLADARRPPEDHRVGLARRAARPAAGLPSPSRCCWPDHLLDGLRPQPLGERDVDVAGCVEEIALHGPILPLILVDSGPAPRPSPRSGPRRRA